MAVTVATSFYDSHRLILAAHGAIVAIMLAFSARRAATQRPSATVV